MLRWALSALVLPGCFYVTADEYADRWDLDADGVERPMDCDDHDPDLQVRTWFVDADEDGFGGAETVEACDPPPDTVATGGDCDDADPDRAPDRAEVCNGVDDDCDQDVDDGVEPPTWFADVDGDTFGDPAAATEACEAPQDHVDNGLDCDDADDDVHPDAPELCNGYDDDCDLLVDFEDGVAEVVWTVDADEDGWGADGGQDREIACDQPAGYGPEGDCDDTDADVNPDADEVCTVLGEDPRDEDCDGSGIDVNAVDAPTWYADVDEDTYGDVNDAVQQCTPKDGYVDNPQDCDDGDDAVNTAALEICDNGVDDNCDMMTDTGPGC